MGRRNCDGLVKIRVCDGMREKYKHISSKGTIIVGNYFIFLFFSSARRQSCRCLLPLYVRDRVARSESQEFSL